MPISWDATMDRKLFLAILKTHDISVDYEKVANELTTPEQPCTTIAVRKRLAKIKIQSKGSAVGNDGDDDSTPKTKGPARKRGARAVAEGESPTKKGKSGKGKTSKNGGGAAGDGSDNEEEVDKGIVKEEAVEDGEDY